MTKWGISKSNVVFVETIFGPKKFQQRKFSNQLKSGFKQVPPAPVTLPLEARDCQMTQSQNKLISKWLA